MFHAGHAALFNESADGKPVHGFFRWMFLSEHVWRAEYGLCQKLYGYLGFN